MRKKAFITNVLVMTGSMLIIRLAGMVANVYISSRAGAEAMGLYHVIFSVYSFAITVSVSGTGLAATRLITEKCANSGKGCRGVLLKCLVISTSASLFASVVLFFGADSVFYKIMADERCIVALKILSFGLVPIGTSAVLRGFFIAKRKVSVLTASQITEEFSSIFITLYLLKNFSGTPYAYIAMIAGNVCSEIIAFVFDIISFKIISRKDSCKKADVSFKNVLNICVPVALGSYLRSGLVAIENVLIPSKLAASGMENPLGEYGIIKGMAMQIMLFPTVFIHSFSSMLVPEMSEMNAYAKKNGIRYVSTLAIRYTLLFSFASAAIFFIYHDRLATSIYKNDKVGIYLGMLSLLAIPLYLDSVVDSMLKGLNEQVASLKFNIADSALRIIAIWLFLPRFGIMAYIVLLYASELFNLSLSLGKLISATGFKINLKEQLVPPAMCSVFSFFIIKQIHLSRFWAEIFVFGAVYLVLYCVIEWFWKKDFSSCNKKSYI